MRYGLPLLFALGFLFLIYGIFSAFLDSTKTACTTPLGLAVMDRFYDQLSGAKKVSDLDGLRAELLRQIPEVRQSLQCWIEFHERRLETAAEVESQKRRIR